MADFILTGDIIKAGRVRVRNAVNKEDAIKRAEEGDFEIVEEVPPFSFTLDADDEDHVEKE